MAEQRSQQNTIFLIFMFLCNFAPVDALSISISSLWYFWFAILFGMFFFVFVAVILGRAAKRKNRVTVVGPQPVQGGVRTHVHHTPHGTHVQHHLNTGPPPQPTAFAQPPPPYTTPQPPPPYVPSQYPPPSNNPAYPPGMSNPSAQPPAPVDPFASAVRQANTTY